MKESRTLVVAWIDRNARTEDLGHWLDAQVLFMPWARPGLPFPQRLVSWCRSAWTTFRAVRRLHAGTIIVIEPPVFAPFSVRLARRKGCRVFLDLHSGAFLHPQWQWAKPLLEFVAKRSDGVIVTNMETLEGANLGGTPAYVLHDPIWSRSPTRVSTAANDGASQEPRYVLFPASGNLDEPLELIEAVGRQLQGGLSIKVTGGVRRPNAPGVEYVGFLSQPDYERLMNGATVVLSLTQWEATMQRSAYEAVYSGIPVVALERRVLRDVFDGAGVVFAQDNAVDLARALNYSLEHRDRLSAETEEARSRLRSGSEVVKQVLLA
jgi:glycosyltransferase involved in cell wall biosynthesis